MTPNPLPPSEPLSSCHNAPVYNGGNGSITGYYICSQCNKDCDVAVASEPQKEPDESSPMTRQSLEAEVDDLRTAVKCIHCEAIDFIELSPEAKEALLFLVDKYAEEREVLARFKGKHDGVRLAKASVDAVASVFEKRKAKATLDSLFRDMHTALDEDESALRQQVKGDK